MATRAGRLERHGDGKFTVTWEQLEENGGTRDVGAAVVLPPVAGPCVAHSTGNFDTSVEVELQGGNDGTNFTDIGSANMTAAAPLVTVTPQPRFVRPAIVADGAADASDVDVTLTCTEQRG